MRYDSHIHTLMSTDGKTEINEAARMALERGVGIVITDHMDWDLPLPFPAFRVDLDAYWEKYGGLRNDRLLIGIELGMTENSAAKNASIIRENDFDFVLGSLHVLHGEDIGGGKDLFQAMGDERVFGDYLETGAQLVQDLNIDAFGHIDYPLRYMEKELFYQDFKERFDALLAALTRRGICLELNTVRLGRGRAAYDNLLEIYRAYKKLGGKYVTLGSDSHTPNAVARNFDLADNFLKETGLIPVHFKKRRMVVDD